LAGDSETNRVPTAISFAFRPLIETPSRIAVFRMASGCRLLMEVAELCLERNDDKPAAVAAMPGPYPNFQLSPVAVFEQDSVILNEQEKHFVMTVRVSKEMVLNNVGALMGLSEACDA
jgi:hypothetical protein